MDFLRRIEDDIKNLAIEAKQRYPDVKDATDTALLKLKTMRDSYVADVMKRTDEGPKLHRSIDIASPYLVACSHADPGSKLTLMALGGLQMLLDFDVLPPSEAQTVLGILTRQASLGRAEVQMKVLQIGLQLANAVAVDSMENFSEDTIRAFLLLALRLCDSSAASVSVSSTALVTTRQITALVLNGAAGTLSRVDSADPVSASGCIKGMLSFVKDLSLVCRLQPTMWLTGIETLVPRYLVLHVLVD